jgi:hypothetical protein
MVKCDERCQLYSRCNVRYPNIQQCVYDMGIYNEDENKDDFLERRMM